MDSYVLNVPWPVEPDYYDWVGYNGAGADSVGAWVAFKLKSGAFHTDTLERIGLDHGYARLTGIEMALDAALAALCGAFDAAVAGIIRAAERYFTQGTPQPPVPWQAILEHQRDWARCVERVVPHLCSEGLSYDVTGMVDDVEGALRRSDNAPLGWLTELQRLRNRTVHQQSLARHIDYQSGGDIDQAEWALAVGARTSRDGTREAGRPEHPVQYLRRVHGQLDDLTSMMVGLVDYLCPNGVPVGRRTA